jgi:hypothetical protein
MVPPDSHAILIGVSRYDDSESFPALQAAANSLRAMRALLVDPELCGWRPEQITMIPDPSSRAQVEELLSDAAERTTGVLLLYYVGHGILSPRLELCLTVTSTRLSRPKITGLPWESVTEILDVQNCPAQVRIAILDCCYAGQIINESMGSSAGVADTVAAEGIYTLTATIRNKTAHVVPADQQELACTSFTGELCDLVREGIAGRSDWVTLGELYPLLRHRLDSKGLPLPNQRGTDTAYRFPFTVNRAARNPSYAPASVEVAAGQEAAAGRATVLRESSPAGSPADRLRERAVAALNAAEQNARTTLEGARKAQTLVRIAIVLARTDPERAERTAQGITDGHQQMLALAGIAQALARTDPDRAERTAQSITDGNQKAQALAGIAQALDPTDTKRTGRLWATAEQTAQAIEDGQQKAQTLARIAIMLARTDPSRAERTAQTITDASVKARAMAGIAQALASTDADRAERIARSITHGYQKALALAGIAQALASADPDRTGRLATEAERVAESITSKLPKAQAFAGVAQALAGARPGQAERVAKGIADPYWQAQALAGIAQVWLGDG